MRGEKLGQKSCHYVSPGSPPHARGKVICIHTFTCPLRITPACAGKSERRLGIAYALRDHPRMRGEKANIKYDDVCDIGSPPHARGKVPFLNAVKSKYRITPACAGKSISTLF